MILGGDHSTADAIIGGSLKRVGLGGGLIRYACGGRGDVNITPAEFRDLEINGIPLGIVLEHEADWLLHGNITARTQASLAVTRACGVPDGVIYAAADFDATNGGPTSPGSPGDHNMDRILTSLQEMSGVPGVGRDNVGFYGSKFGIDWLVSKAPWIKWYWQTEAWSMGERNPHACLFQRAQSMNVDGVSVDVDEILKPQWGQRVHETPPPADPFHYEWFDNTIRHIAGVWVSERNTVQQYDKLRVRAALHVRQLGRLRVQLSQFASRIVTVAEEQADPKTGQPDFGSNHRGWRLDQLDRRAEGNRLT